MREAESMGKACSNHGREAIATKFRLKNLEERNHMEYLGAYGKIILK